MPTLRDHAKATFPNCRKILPDRIGCGGRMFWGPADGPAHMLVFEGVCSHCGWLAYSADVLNGSQPMAQPTPKQPQRRGAGRPFQDGNTYGRWRRIA